MFLRPNCKDEMAASACVAIQSTEREFFLDLPMIYWYIYPPQIKTRAHNMLLRSTTLEEGIAHLVGV
jgi:hypothetical protein